jgi:phosphatidate phosphatase APP1
MTLMVLDHFKKALRRWLHLLARPARADRGRGGIVIQPYRGFGSQEESFFMGRVFHQQRRGNLFQNNPVARDAIDLLRRLFRKGIPHAQLEVRVNEATQTVETDQRGYFQAHLHHRSRGLSERIWYPTYLNLLRPRGPNPVSGTVGKVFIPPPSARFVVISDIDDTVVFTGVARKIKMIWRIFIQNARTRTPFPGVRAFYWALHHGVTGGELNPMLYVSRGPWSIYEMLDEFFNHHNIPIGPILFLRDWGIALKRPFPLRAEGHKLTLIHKMVELYRDLPFILIGDSGQHDPEIYARIVRNYPGRVLAIYIRNVGGDPLRDRAIATLAREVEAADSALLLTDNTFEMAAHAESLGLIPPTALSALLTEQAIGKEH